MNGMKVNLISAIELIVANRKNSEKYLGRIEKYAPTTDTVRILRLTEKQYANIYMISGKDDLQEKIVG